MRTLIAAALTLALAGPALAFDSGITTWDNTQCLNRATGVLYACDRYSLKLIDRDVAEMKAKAEASRTAAAEAFARDAAYWRRQAAKRSPPAPVAPPASCWQCMHGCGSAQQKAAWCSPQHGPHRESTVHRSRHKARPAAAPEAPSPAFCRWWALDAPQCAA